MARASPAVARSADGAGDAPGPAAPGPASAAGPPLDSAELAGAPGAQATVVPSSMVKSTIGRKALPGMVPSPAIVVLRLRLGSAQAPGGGVA
jgi:hypothetical protein